MSRMSVSMNLREYSKLRAEYTANKKKAKAGEFIELVHPSKIFADNGREMLASINGFTEQAAFLRSSQYVSLWATYYSLNELIKNAGDAGATELIITLIDGAVHVTDNGHGIIDGKVYDTMQKCDSPLVDYTAVSPDGERITSEKKCDDNQDGGNGAGLSMLNTVIKQPYSSETPTGSLMIGHRQDGEPGTCLIITASERSDYDTVLREYARLKHKLGEIERTSSFIDRKDTTAEDSPKTMTPFFGMKIKKARAKAAAAKRRRCDLEAEEKACHTAAGDGEKTPPSYR